MLLSKVPAMYRLILEGQLLRTKYCLVGLPSEPVWRGVRGLDNAKEARVNVTNEVNILETVRRVVDRMENRTDQSLTIPGSKPLLFILEVTAAADSYAGHNWHPSHKMKPAFPRFLSIKIPCFVIHGQKRSIALVMSTLSRLGPHAQKTWNIDDYLRTGMSDIPLTCRLKVIEKAYQSPSLQSSVGFDTLKRTLQGCWTVEHLRGNAVVDPAWTRLLSFTLTSSLHLAPISIWPLPLQFPMLLTCIVRLALCAVRVMK